MLNLPQFEERPPARVHAEIPAGARAGGGTPVTAGPGASAAAGGHDAPDSDAAMVANLQFNSPLAMYSGENVMEAVEGQTGGRVSSVVGYSVLPISSFIRYTSQYPVARSPNCSR